MKIYQVGGSVRDMLMGVASQDRDWVAVGARPEQFLEQGFTQVGADFPVFLHPITGDEYALARTERKSGNGYHGFQVGIENVTLEEDLMRRDLTINAMALSMDGDLVDPYGGHTDLHNMVLRHVSPAFAEDPLRILRVLRFLARFGHRWTIAPETKALMHQMVQDGEADYLVPERIWKETSRALMEQRPDLYLEGLREFGLTTRPCFAPYRFAGMCTWAVQRAAQRNDPLPVRAALAFGDSREDKQRPGGMPDEIWKAVLAWAEFGSNHWLKAPQEHAGDVQAFLERVNAFKDKDTVDALLGCWECIGKSVELLRAVLERARAVDFRAIASGMTPGPAVGQAIRQARIDAIRAGTTVSA